MNQHTPDLIASLQAAAMALVTYDTDHEHDDLLDQIYVSLEAVMAPRDYIAWRSLIEAMQD